MISSGQSWKSSRTRERNRARYLIKNHVDMECDKCSHNSNESTFLLHSEFKSDVVQDLFKAVAMGNPSYFSLKLIASHYSAIQSHHSFEFISVYKITTLCTSRFGKEYATAALHYRQYKGDFTMMEYASIVGEYGIMSSLLAGGINPLPIKSFEGSTGRQERVSKMVLRKFVASMVPKTLSIYVIQTIFIMKMWSFYHGTIDGKQSCPLCYENSPLIPCPGNCNHSCCELCHWERAVLNLDERLDGDVMPCPVCESTIDHLPSKTIVQVEDRMQRRNESLERFNALIPNIEELKKLQRPPRKKNVIYSTWNDALKGTCGHTKDVRRDKFLKCVASGAIHHCRACIRAGVDINDTNEFHQSPLYIASWSNNFNVVKLLLEWGADPNLTANGNLSVLNVAQAHGYRDIVEILEQYGANYDVAPLRDRIYSSADSELKDRQKEVNVCTLIPTSSTHPGSGSYYMDDCVSEEILQFLLELHSSIPEAEDCHIKKKKNRTCSLRHNFCDGENAVCDILESVIESSLKKNAIVFPHMKFLHYDTPGSVLPPHIDLSKVDPLSQRRSTHTFILYLHDSEDGGETALLKELSSDGPYAYHEVIVKVKPCRGRLLLFPHACPHEGMEVVSTPKLLLRGEVAIFTDNTAD